MEEVKQERIGSNQSDESQEVEEKAINLIVYDQNNGKKEDNYSKFRLLSNPRG